MSDGKAQSVTEHKVTAWGELRPLLHPHRALIAVIAVTVLLAEAFAVIPPLLMARIIDDHLAVGVRQGVLVLALLFLAARTVAEGLDFVVTYLTGKVAQETLRDLRVRLFAHLQRLPLGYYDRTPLGDAISRCTADVDTVDTLFTTGISRLLTRMVQLLTALAAMVILSPPLALFALLLIPPLALVTRFFQVRIRDAERDRRRVIGALNVHLQETLSGIEVVRAFGHGDGFSARFRLALGRSLDAYTRALSYNVFYTPLLTVLVATGVALLLWAGTGGLGLTLGISIGTLTAFILLFQRFFEPIRNLGEDWQTVQSASTGIERIVEVLEVPAGHATSPETSFVLGGMDTALPGNGALVELRDVSFGYVSGRPVLNGITLAVQPGEQLALVGRTGAGKSSTIHLLCGLYAPWSGQISVAGTDPLALSDAERRYVVGVVPQTVQMFGGTVWDNLTLGDASAPRERVEQAARMAGVDRFVSALPEGYNTRLSGAGRGKGIRLSEGQQQLLSLARSLVWDPVLLLLDEATAAVDNVSEAEFRTALRAALRGHDGCQRAAITVAHRLSTAREADRVVVLENGYVVEQGAPEELIRQGGRFAAMVELEAAGWNWQSDL
ncbi:MAG: ABC transporter ATP-binding protein [Anaerolineae bacterium]|jgi:ATP-binding cassette subfamily B protein